MLFDNILKRMPNLPAALHVFDPQALWIHGGPLAATAVIAALYLMRTSPAADRACSRRGDGMIRSRERHAPDVIVEAANVTRSFAMPAGDVVRSAYHAVDYLASTPPSAGRRAAEIGAAAHADAWTHWELRFDGQDISALNDLAPACCGRGIGFVFQRFFLLPMARPPRTPSCQSEAALPATGGGAAVSSCSVRGLPPAPIIGRRSRRRDAARRHRARLRTGRACAG